MTLTLHDPGGKVRQRVQDGITSAAVFGGPGDCYRYSLRRSWDMPLIREGGLDAPAAGAMVNFVMMNPSTADEQVNDPTVKRCQDYARRWGYSGLIVTNTFAYRATDQLRLAEVEDPVGPENDEWILREAKSAALVVMAYGAPKVRKLQRRGYYVANMLRGAGILPHVFRLGADGAPVHPLYQRADAVLLPWE